MKTRNVIAMFSTGIAALAMGCGAKVAVDSGDVNGVNPNNSKFGVFESRIVIANADLDADGAADDALAILATTTADLETVCADITGAAVPQDEAFALGFALQIQIDGGAGAEIAADVAGDGLNNVVDAAMIVFQGGVLIANTAGNGDGAFTFVKGGDNLTADITATQQLDFADTANFDTDLDADGINDAKTLTPTDISISVKKVEVCAGLIQALFGI